MSHPCRTHWAFDLATEAPLRFTENEAEDFSALLERFAFALRAYGIPDGPLLDRAVYAAVKAAWPVLKRDEEARETARASLIVVK